MLREQARTHAARALCSATRGMPSLQPRTSLPRRIAVASVRIGLQLAAAAQREGALTERLARAEAEAEARAAEWAERLALAERLRAGAAEESLRHAERMHAALADSQAAVALLQVGPSPP